ncbi:MAG: hypothetical protein AB9834_10530 [Lentimicrobium sp.]
MSGRSGEWEKGRRGEGVNGEKWRMGDGETKGLRDGQAKRKWKALKGRNIKTMGEAKRSPWTLNPKRK